MTALPATGPSGSWTHSHEEDVGGIQVFRPSLSFDFPPSRGRRSLDFVAPGEVIVGGPGADDREQRRATSFTEVGPGRFRIGDGRIIDILEYGPDLMKLRQL